MKAQAPLAELLIYQIWTRPGKLPEQVHCPTRFGDLQVTCPHCHKHLELTYPTECWRSGLALWRKGKLTYSQCVCLCEGSQHHPCVSDLPQDSQDSAEGRLHGCDLVQRRIQACAVMAGDTGTDSPVESHRPHLMLPQLLVTACVKRRRPGKLVGAPSAGVFHWELLVYVASI